MIIRYRVAHFGGGKSDEQCTHEMEVWRCEEVLA